MRRLAIAVVLLATSGMPAIPDIAESCFQYPERDCLLREAARLAREAERAGLSGNLAVGIARRLVEDGQVYLALEIAEAVVDPITRSWAVSTVAWEQAEAGNAAALTTAARIPDEGRRASALAGIARAQIVHGELDEALSTYALIDTASTHRNDWGIAALELGETLVAAGKTHDALTLAQAITDAEFRARLLRSIADAQVEAGDGAGADDSRRASLEAAAMIDDPRKRTQESIKTLIALGRLDDAMLLVDDMPMDNWRDRARDEIATAYAQAGEVAALQAMLPMIETPLSRIWALGGIAVALTERGDRDGASHHLALALDEAGRIEGNDSYRDNLVAIVAAVWMQIGFFDEALALVLQLRAQAPKLSLVLAVARGQAGDGHCERASTTANDALSTLNAISPDDGVEISAALVQLARLRDTCGDHEGANDLWSMAAAAARDLSDLDRRDHLIGELVSDMIADGRLDDGMALWVHLRDPITRAVSLTELAEAQAAAGNLTQALALARKIDDPRGDAWALELIAGLQVRMGDIAGALATTERIDLPLSRARALVAIAFALPQ